jgi:hypothetical protein
VPTEKQEPYVKTANAMVASLVNLSPLHALRILAVVYKCLHSIVPKEIAVFFDGRLHVKFLPFLVCHIPSHLTEILSSELYDANVRIGIRTTFLAPI